MGYRYKVLLLPEYIFGNTKGIPPCRTIIECTRVNRVKDRFVINTAAMVTYTNTRFSDICTYDHLRPVRLSIVLADPVPGLAVPAQVQPKWKKND